MLTDFQNSFTIRISKKFETKLVIVPTTSSLFRCARRQPSMTTTLILARNFCERPAMPPVTLMRCKLPSRILSDEGLTTVLTTQRHRSVLRPIPLTSVRCWLRVLEWRMDTHASAQPVRMPRWEISSQVPQYHGSACLRLTG